MSKENILENLKLNKMIVDYLRKCDMEKIANMIEFQIQSKYVDRNHKPFLRGVNIPRLIDLQDSGWQMNLCQVNFQREFRLTNKKYRQVINVSKNVFEVTVKIIQMLESFKEAKKSDVNEMIETSKIQLTKQYKIIQNQGKPQGEEPTEVVFHQHKQKLEKCVANKNLEGICQVFLSFRVNALQIAPQLRKNLVYQLIRNDLFQIYQNQNLNYLIFFIDQPNSKLRYAFIPLVSIICSTLKGVEYITFNKDMSIIRKVIKIMLQENNGSVIQRFCLALLQKCSVKDTIIPTFLEYDIINWVMILVKKSLKQKIHHFSLDFASALLANIIHAPSTLQSMTPKIANQLMESMLKFITEPNLQVSILMHFLICLSYLSKQERFVKQKQSIKFVQKISQFVELYSQKNTSDNEAAQIDKRTVLDLCAHMFHPKDIDLDDSAIAEYNQLKTQDRIREYQNEQGELIFECFQDEV